MRSAPLALSKAAWMAALSWDPSATQRLFSLPPGASRLQRRLQFGPLICTASVGWLGALRGVNAPIAPSRSVSVAAGSFGYSKLILAALVLTAPLRVPPLGPALYFPFLIGR
jgi:hypothetical protein